MLHAKTLVGKVFKRTKFYFLGFLILLLLMTSFYVSTRRVLLENYQELGTSIANSYSSEVNGDINLFRSLLALGAKSIDAGTVEGRSPEEIQVWIHRYYERLQEVLGEGIVDPYVVIGGRIIGANPWPGDEDYDYASTEWYRKAVEANGRIIFTKMYRDAISGRSVVTLAQKCEKSDAVIAFDIFPENIQLYANRVKLPEQASLYICDENGIVIYYDTKLKGSHAEIEAYLQRIHAGMQDGSLQGYDASIVNQDGEARGVYAAPIDVGWTVYITIPFEIILKQLDIFTTLFTLVSLPCLAILLFVSWRNLRLDFGMEQANETIQALGKLYYALYRVNCRDDTYEMIKGSEYFRERLPQKGSYGKMLRVAEEVIEPEAFKDFSKNFSSDGIRNLVAKNLRNYGGDFLRRFGNTYRWVNVRILFDRSQDSGEVVLCFREVDDEKHQQLQERKLLQEALASAKRSEKAKQAFFSNMSHDMRTPLNAISSLADLTLRHAEDPEKVRGYGEKIAYSSRQLLHLVNDILDISRMEQGKTVLSNQTIDLEDCILACASPFRLQAEAEKKQFIVDCTVCNRWVLGDPVRIGQILNNLLSNAFKFTTAGDRITLSVKEFQGIGRSQYQFMVKDTGMGMSEEFLPHLFEPYSRETRFSTRQISGTGLGMPIVKSLITEMSGQIHVDSTHGEGTTFTITIPFATIEDSGVGTEKSETCDRIPRSSLLQGKKILLAEDNELNMEIASEILGMNGIEVLKAWNGEEAVEKFKASALFEIDAILMDMQMPQMDGCEATQHIRALPRPDAGLVPILAVTANAFSEDIAATSAAGMDAHISKPIDFTVLCRTLEQLTQKKSADYGKEHPAG